MGFLECVLSAGAKGETIFKLNEELDDYNSRFKYP